MYAIIKTCGRQYRVSEGDIVSMDLLEAEDGSTVTFSDVLMVGGDAVRLGTPMVSGAKVEAKVLGQFKGKKVEGMYFRRRKDCKKRIGHRQQYTRVQITRVAV